jgi:hypothetical protein
MQVLICMVVGERPSCSEARPKGLVERLEVLMPK